MIAAEQTSDLNISRVGELREKQRSLRDSLPMDRTSSSLSMTSSLNSDRSDPSEDPERLARSLSRIKIRRPSASAGFSVDMTGIADAKATEGTKKGETDTISTSEMTPSRRQSTGGIISKMYGKTILANYPVQESAISRAYKNTILANYPVPSETVKEEQDVTETTLSISDDGSSNQSRTSRN